MVRLVAGAFATLAVLGASSAGCSVAADDDATGVDEGRSVVGDDDRVVVDDEGTNVPAKYRKLLDAFGVLTIGGGFCTVTHVGGGVAITAGHCFGATDVAKRDYAPADSASIRWGVRGSSKATWPYLMSTVTRVLEAKRALPGADYAFVLVDPAPPETAAVSVDTDHRPSNGARVTIFSHPWGGVLKWSPPCQVMPPGDYAGPLRFQYACDTEGGSSGAAVLDDATLAVIGIHDGDDATTMPDGTERAATANNATYLVDTPIEQYLNRR